MSLCTVGAVGGSRVFDFNVIISRRLPWRQDGKCCHLVSEIEASAACRYIQQRPSVHDQ